MRLGFLVVWCMLSLGAVVFARTFTEDRLRGVQVTISQEITDGIVGPVKVDGSVLMGDAQGNPIYGSRRRFDPIALLTPGERQTCQQCFAAIKNRLRLAEGVQDIPSPGPTSTP